MQTSTIQTPFIVAVFGLIIFVGVIAVFCLVGFYIFKGLFSALRTTIGGNRPNSMNFQPNRARMGQPGHGPGTIPPMPSPAFNGSIVCDKQNCFHENPVGARYCRHCGQAFPLQPHRV